MDSINGQMAGNIWVIGKRTSWMISVYIPGKMAECMKGSTSRTRNTVTECTHGVTRSAMLAGGVRANNMESEYSSVKKVKRSLVFGKMARRYDGLTKMKLSL
jgi:hypothetical protein